MSTFSNRRGPAVGAVSPGEQEAARGAQRAYIDALLALLGDHDPLTVLRETPHWLQAIVQDLSGEHLNAPEAPGKWSIGGVIDHLADSEVVWGFRLRMVLAEDRPNLAGYDQDRWADAFDYAHPRVAETLPVLETLRKAHLARLARLSAADWERVAVHAERGEESVRHMVRLYAGHDLVHRQQIERIRRGHN